MCVYCVLTVFTCVYVAVHGYTVEPPNKGQVGAWALVHYSGVVLYWGVFVKKPYLCVVSIELYILLVYKLLWSVLEQQ